MTESKYTEKIKKFLKAYCWNDILQLANEYPDVRSLAVNFVDIEKFDRDLSKAILDHPGELIPAAEEALEEIELPVDKTLEAHIRIFNVPNKIEIRKLRSNHLGKLVSVEGMIRKATETRPRITKAAFQCLRCGHVTLVEQNSTKFEEPFGGCEEETCGKKGPFKVLIEESTFIDAQKLQIQEPPENLRGTQAQSLDIDVDDDLADLVVPGERAIITGVLLSRQRSLKDGKSPFYDILIEANSIERLGTDFDEIEISREDEEAILELSKDPEIYNKLIASIAPSIHGMEDVKEAMILQLYSGVPKITPDGSTIRGDIHMLLVGDPSKAKTKLMKASQKRSPRAIFTSGKSTSAGGLTAVAVKDDKGFGEGRWVLEAGALVMGDKGIVYVDEGDKMRPGDRDALHEAMEQQEINISKAGILATLKTRTSVFMTINPKHGRFDRYEGLAEQINLPPTLLSRFDCIFLLLDNPDPVEDSNISNHILETHIAGEMLQQHDISGNISAQDLEAASKHAQPVISPELFKKHVAYTRRNVFPVMSLSAKSHIHSFYLELRKTDPSSKTSKTIPITTRQEEAMIRLAEASARIRLSSTVTHEDAARATRLMLTCLHMVGIDPETGALDVDSIEVGTSTNQRANIKLLKEAIQKVCERHPHGKAPLEEVYVEAGKGGIVRTQAEEHIRKMRQRGDIFAPDKDHIKIISKDL